MPNLTTQQTLGKIKKKIGRQRCERVKTLFLRRFWSHDLSSTSTLPGHVVASFNKTLYDDYLCLVASNKQQIQSTKIRRNVQEH